MTCNHYTRTLLLLLLFLCPSIAHAQIVTADLFRLNPGLCGKSSGTGTPEGSKVGKVCDEYKRVDTGQLYHKISGTGTTGWVTWTPANVANNLVSRDGSGGVFVGPLNASTGLFSSLTPGRVVFGSTGGLLVDDPDFTFVGDTATATKIVAPTSLTTPQIYGRGTPNVLALGGSGVGCTSYPACESLQWTFDTTMMRQRFTMNPAFETRWYVDPYGGHLSSASGAGRIPLRLDGGPTTVQGGGLHVGASAILDPGLGNSALDGYIGSPTYVSQLNGWRIDRFGAADFPYIFAQELHANKFIADMETALRGMSIVSVSSGQLGVPFVAPAPAATALLIMKDIPEGPNEAIFETGDYIWIKNLSRIAGGVDISNLYGRVTDYVDLADGLQQWTFTRLGADSGLMAAGTVVEVDSIVIDVGVPGNGWTMQSAIDGIHGINSPYFRVITWTGASPSAANQHLIANLGNVRGITGNDNEHGLLTGDYAPTDGKYFRCTNLVCELHGVDFNMWSGTSRVFRIEHTTPYLSMGAPIDGGAPTTYGSGRGLFAGIVAGSMNFRVGDPAPLGEGLFWNGATGNLNIKGTVTVTGGNAAMVDLSNVTGGYAGSPTPGGAATGIVGQGALATQSAAAWATQITGIPSTLQTPAAPGLYLTSTATGYWNGSAFTAYLDNNSSFFLGAGGASLLYTTAGGLVINGGGTFSGALSAATGTFSGALSAATGTFAGSLSAATGTFAGSLSAATGTFSGTLGVGVTGSFATGAVTIDGTDGIRIQPSTVNDPDRAYKFVTAMAGDPAGLYMLEQGGVTRTLTVDNNTGGASSVTRININANNSTAGRFARVFLESTATGTPTIDMTGDTRIFGSLILSDGTAFGSGVGNLQLNGVNAFAQILSSFGGTSTVPAFGFLDTPGTNSGFYKAVNGVIGVTLAGSVLWAFDNGGGVCLCFRPSNDNQSYLGSAGFRWKDFFSVTKTSVVNASWTKSGTVLVSVREGPEYTLSDSGTVTLDAAGRATVRIDPHLVEVANTGVPYRVLTSGARVTTKTSTTFVLVGVPGDVVDWEINATRAGFENVRWRDQASETIEPLGLADPDEIRNHKDPRNNTATEPVRRVVPVKAAKESQ